MVKGTLHQGVSAMRTILWLRPQSLALGRARYKSAAALGSLISVVTDTIDVTTLALQRR
jgi:hypothetical protein